MYIALEYLPNNTPVYRFLVKSANDIVNHVGAPGKQALMTSEMRS